MPPPALLGTSSRRRLKDRKVHDPAHNSLIYSLMLFVIFNEFIDCRNKGDIAQKRRMPGGIGDHTA